MQPCPTLHKRKRPGQNKRLNFPTILIEDMRPGQRLNVYVRLRQRYAYSMHKSVVCFGLGKVEAITRGGKGGGFARSLRLGNGAQISRETRVTAILKGEWEEMNHGSMHILASSSAVSQ